MAARPVLQKLTRDISMMPGGEQWVFEQIADGVPIGKIASKLGISRTLMYQWRNQQEHRRPMWEEAMRLSAQAHAEGGLEDLDDLVKDGKVPTGTEVQLGLGKAKYRQWLAKKYDPEQFGDKGLELNFSIGQIHLNAVEDAKRLTAPGTSVVEAEVLDVEDSDEGGDDDVPGGDLSGVVGIGDSGEGETSGAAAPSAAERPVETQASPGALPEELLELL